jgi:hypothetical protein
MEDTKTTLDITHFTKADLVNLGSCFLDPKGNFIFGDGGFGVHEALAFDILEDLYGDDLDAIYEVQKDHHYTYEAVQDELGYIRYSDWVGPHGVFIGKKDKLSYAQKLAIRAFCKANGTTWEQVSHID